MAETAAEAYAILGEVSLTETFQHSADPQKALEEYQKYQLFLFAERRVKAMAHEPLPWYKNPLAFIDPNPRSFRMRPMTQKESDLILEAALSHHFMESVTKVSVKKKMNP